MAFETACLCKTGGRIKNEDSCAFIKGCWVVADGLGGHEGGEIASKTAVDTVIRQFTAHSEVSEDSVRKLITEAHGKIKQIQGENRRVSSMRTTIVILLSNEKNAIWGHVGDSRLYFFRNGSIEAQTKDNSVAQAMVNAGEIAFEQIRFNDDRNRLLKVLGEKGNPEPSVGCIDGNPQKGDAFLLCTDGFWEYVTENEMQEDLSHSDNPQDWLTKMEERLVKKVTGENDNFTAMAIMVL